MPSRRSLPFAAVAVAALSCNAVFGVDDLSFDGAAIGGSSSSGTGGGTAGGGGTSGSGGHAGASGGSGGQGSILDSFSYRRLLTIETSVDLPTGYSLSFILQHGDLVNEGKARVDGGDVRVALMTDNELTEIDRVLDPRSTWGEPATTLWFATQVPLGAGEAGSYFL